LKRRRTAVLLVALLALFVVLDGRRAPADQLATRAAVGTIHLYQGTLSKIYAHMGVQCRFSPSCSHYAEECIRRYGAARGSWMAAKRVLRCGPWTPAGTIDPPPIA
jgi:uncharacterized protein